MKTAPLSRLVLLLCVGALVCVGGCGGCAGPRVAEGPGPRDDGSLLFRQAQAFDRFVQDRMAPEEREAYRNECRTSPDHSPFCYSVNRASQLLRFKERRERIAAPVEKRDPRPAVPVFGPGNRLKNARALRREGVQSLLAGLRAVDEEQLLAVGNTAAKLKGCPNRLGIAAAALLEDRLPRAELLPLIADLYEAGGRCSARGSADREHFLTRSALFHLWRGQPAVAARLLEQVAPGDAFSGRTRYWLHRARQMAMDLPGADRALDQLLARHPFSFHAMAAAVDSQVDLAARFANQPPESWPNRTRHAGVNSVTEQAEVLKRYGFDATAALLAAWVVGSFPRLEPGLKLHLATLGDAHLQVTTVPLLLIYHPSYISRESLELNYPRAFFALFQSNGSGVDPYLLLALARKESQFDPKAVSPANAQGLLQLHPLTGEKLAGRSGVDFHDPAVSVRLASRYVAMLLKEFKGSLPQAVAAYNAGEERVRNWVVHYPTDDPVLFTDLIPYRETRDYVGYVLANYYWYRRLYQGDSVEPLRQAVARKK